MDEEHIDEPKKPGQYLAYEREKKGFTIEDIAGKLRLSPHVIRAIEEEVHDKLPEMVYVRGYIRAYCRLLHIDSVPVLDMYAANLPQEEDNLLEDLSSDSPLNERHQKNIIFWGSIAVASIFLALIIGWWQENRPTPSPLSEQPVSLEDAAPTLVDEPPVSPEDAAPAVADELPVSPEDAIEQSETPGIPPQQETAQSPSDSETMSENINVPNDEIQPAVSNAEADTELNNERPNAIDDVLEPVTLVVMSSGESWARVTDGGGDIFIHRILSNGYNKIFMVNLPLKFEFGNAHQVNIMIDGKDYDMSSYIKPNKVANFEVTELP